MAYQSIVIMTMEEKNKEEMKNQLMKLKEMVEDQKKNRVSASELLEEKRV